MNNIFTHTTQSEESGIRLDVFLSERVDNSRTVIQKHIIQGLVRINDNSVKKNYVLKEGDIISYTPETEAINTKELTLPEIPIIEVTDDFIVVNKPSGVVVHPDSAHPQGSTLIDTLVARYPELIHVGEEEGRPGVIHRLDKPVSGVMVIARTQNMYEHLKKQFQGRTIVKKYIALVHGVVEQDHDDITYTIARKKDGYMAAKTDKQEGRTAHTVIDVIKRYPNNTLVDLQIKTGRTHQIRVHLLAYGHPIVGEPIYMSKKYRSSAINEQVPHVFLHAHTLQFTDLDGEVRLYESAIPKELSGLVDKLDNKYN